jgi:hypothetical protein
MDFHVASLACRRRSRTAGDHYGSSGIPGLREKDAERRNDPAPELRAAELLARAHEKAMLDTVDACFQALVDAQTAISVRRHFKTEPIALLDTG